MLEAGADIAALALRLPSRLHHGLSLLLGLCYRAGVSHRAGVVGAQRCLDNDDLFLGSDLIHLTNREVCIEDKGNGGAPSRTPEAGVLPGAFGDKLPPLVKTGVF